VKSVPNCQLEIMPEAGHAVWMDDPTHMANATARWLSQTTDAMSTRPDRERLS